MAENETSEAIDNEIARGDMDTVRKPRKDKYVPTYQVVGDSRIPVSKAHGSHWQSRRDQALSQRRNRNHVRAWSEAIRYYRNDQMQHRDDTDGDDAGNEASAMKPVRRFSETENIVFANVSALVPTLYAKNPSVEFTTHDPADKEFVPIIEKLVNRIMSKKSHPGINLKPKARKGVVMATLTNAAYVEVGYTFRELSSEQAMQDLEKLGAELAKAKSPARVREIEGQLEALEHTVDLLRPSGPFAKFRRPHDVLWDTDGIDDDHDDARWCMIRDHLSTDYLNAKFTQKKGNKRVSVFKPTHVVQAGERGEEGHNTAENEINNSSLFNLDDDDKKSTAADYGYTDEAAYRRAQRTCVWWVWDKVTQRVLLYADKDWSWPIWVWDDPYKLQGFFPVYKLQFYTDPEEPTGKGEVTYYLDQQDAINTINSEMKQARQWARRNLFYDKNKVSADEVEKFMKGDEDVAVGVDVPEGMNLKDFVQSVTPPSMQFVQLFDKAPILEAIDRVSSVQPVMRGTEFKTNTTNQAINQYNSTQQTRTDEKIDAVEDWLGRIGWAMAQLSLMFMTQDDVAALIGDTDAQGWKNYSAGEIARKFQMTVVGGSTQKPTAESKKQQALNMGQVLGQFVNAAPVPVLSVLLQTLRGAFNDVIPDEQWQLIVDAIGQQGGGAQPPAQGEGGGQGASTPPGDAAPNADPIAALEQVVDAMPPEAKQALGMAMARGVPVREALERIIPQAGGEAQQQPA